ncbi:hypothetical protein AOLI_G00273630 [Acnodon oligacanthus]
MNGDMPHVPITTLAGIAGLTDLLNQLPLPSPLPGTTTKSLLYSVRVVEEVERLLACRDDALATQLAGGLAQVSTEHIELKDSLSTDELEGDVPVLLQLLLSRNPSIFRAKSTPPNPQYGTQTGLAQQQLTPPFKVAHNTMQGSPASNNYQQGSVTHSPSGRFVAGQTGSGGRFLSQQTSPVPSPYTPQSPVTAYRQYPHPPAYSQPQQLQQGSVASPMIPGGMRDPLDSKDTMRSFSGAPPLLQSSPPYTPPQEAELLLGSAEKGRGLKGGDEEKGGVYDVVGSPGADGGKVREARSRATVEAELGGVFTGSDPEGELVEALAAIERMESEAAMETDRTAKEVQDKDKPLKKRKQDSHPQEPGAGGCGGVAVGNRLALAEGGAVGGAEDGCGSRHWPQEPQEGVTPKPLQRGSRHDDRQADAPRQKHRPEGRHDEGDDSKPGELPAYGLGENSGFKEPEGAGPGEAVGLPLGWKQPRVCLERLEAEPEPKKSVKPVVVLQKLSRDEVERLIRERESRAKAAKNRLTAGRYGKGGVDPSVLKDLPPELLAEIESTMPLCERVKMNKRKRSTANERPRYAEESSDDEELRNPDSARKRQKKDRDRTWEFEERDRRSSGDHRRAHDGRRGRGARYDDSEEDSPPPSLSDVARSLRKKEKEKKRKAYEPKLTAEGKVPPPLHTIHFLCCSLTVPVEAHHLDMFGCVCLCRNDGLLTFKRSAPSIDSILENLEDVDFTAQDDDEIPQELLLGKHQLSELSSESAKIKAMGISDRIPTDKLVKLLNILEKNILDGANLSTLMSPENEGEDEERLWRDLIMEQHKSVNSTRLVACITTLYLFSKIRAHLMVKHAMTMQPYLTTKCSSQSDFMVICNVAKILELVVPLMEHPSESFLTTMEEDLMKLILKYGMTVVQHCVSCLGAVVNKVTHNYKFVWACFNRYYGALTKLKVQHQEGSSSLAQAATKAALLRSLFTVGALCRHFDFDLEQFKGTTKIEIKEKVLELLLYFTNHEDEEVKCKAIIGLGFMFIMHPSQMFVPEVKTLYNGLLSDSKSSITLKIQVLKNLQMYLQEEDSRMQEADREWQKLSKQEDLKEMGDISSGMSSSIMQLYLKQVLEAFFHTQSSVRHFALNVIALTLSQGLIHPVQCVPYLVAMGTDPEPTMRNKADQQLVEIDKKYTGFIHMKAVAGMKMAYQVQQAVIGSCSSIIRGFRKDESNTALCSHLYSMVRNSRNQRRAFLVSLLNLFDDSSKLEVRMLLFVADNLAYFPYQTQEEPLFIMHHIDIMLSVSGSNLLQTFKESLVRPPGRTPRKQRPRARARKEREEEEEEERREEGSEEERGEGEREEEEEERVTKAQEPESDSDSDLDNADAVMERLPDDTTPLLDFARASQGILLLLVLKQHLKNLYGFSDGKIQKYSPSESAKVYDKAVNRKSNVHFSPRQTIDFLSNSDVRSELTEQLKRKIVKQYLDFKLLMEHLDPDEEEEEGEASAAVRNKAITALLGAPGGSSPRNHHTPDSEEDDSEGDDRTPGASRRGRRAADSADVLQANLNESVSALDIIAIHWPRYRDRPQLARVIQRTSEGYSVQWMAGSYSSPWSEAKRRDGRKLVPWMETIRESDIVYKKIALTSGNKLSHKLAQALRGIYANRDRNSS